MKKNIHVIDHPLMQHKLGVLRDKNTRPAEFRRLMSEMASILAYECTHHCSLEKKKVETPLGVAEVATIADRPVIVSIMRAGNGMLEGIMNMLPFASVGHVGIYRDRFINNTIEYYFRLPPDLKGRQIILTDPLLATGDTAIATIDRIKQYGVGEIKFLCLLAAPKGLERMLHFHPDVQVYTVAQEEQIDAQGYLIPGMGDAGSRLFHFTE
jgi:uracil phosphoribosyltransferase